MKLVLFLALTISSLSFAGKNIYDFSYKTIDNKEVSFKTYKDKVLLISNVATRCGFTPQLKTLESVYQKYKDQGLVVMGVPSNDFGGQTPEVNKKVKAFCESSYGVTFPLTDKYSVTGPNKPGFVHFLLAGSNNKNITWNFEKFIVNKKGQVIKRFPSAEKPDSKAMVQTIEKAIKNEL